MKNDLSKTLVTGSAGMVGSYIDFGIRLTHEELDITDDKAVFEMMAIHKPTAIIHLAAATDLKRCEENPDYAYRVNSLGTYYLALAARQIGAKFIYISTNSVFDGRQSESYKISDTPNPQHVYGHSKYLGELAVSGLLENYAIIRTCWIFGGGRGKDRKLIGKIMEKIEQRALEIQAAEDHFGSPTYGKDLVMGIQKILLDDMQGTFHMVNTNICSRAQEVSEIVKITGSQAAVKPVPAATFGLATNRLHEALEPHPNILRPWQEALKEYLDTEW
ncbi:MAG: NAD(P)-dependent oxidoreductase [Patescibacteria group bacterium]